MAGRDAQGIAVHARRYAPFYVFAVVAAVIVAVMPTDEPDAPGAFAGSGEFDPSAFDPTAPAVDDPAAGGDGPAGAPSTARGARGASSGAAVAGTGGGGGAGRATVSEDGVPLTRGGFECTPGTRQLPWSSYAAPCVPVFTGDNGGETWRGVDGDSIKVVVRSFATDSNGSALDAVLIAAGVDREENRRRQLVFIEYFNKVFELYGRTVEVVPFTSNGNPFDEANGRGREQACADATEIAEEIGAFAVMPADGIAYGPFTECAAERGLVTPVAAYGFPEQFYARLHPYAWGVQMNCNRINRLYVEYVVKRLKDGEAVYASDPLYQTQPRRFGIIRPDIEYYFPCIRLADEEFEKHGIDIVSRFDYVLDPSTLPGQMNSAVVQFKADGVNSLLSVADFLTMINLTQAAARQGWGPEWVLQGSGLQDTYSFARLYDQSVVDGHMFGMSQTGDTGVIWADDGEIRTSYRAATGDDIDPPEAGNYLGLVHMFNLLQSAGPNLTPQSLGDGAFRLPPSTPSLIGGRWDFNLLADGTRGRQHTASTDAREAYWTRQANGPDGNAGEFVSTLGGRRFGVGQWPSGSPDIPREQ